MTVMKQRSIMPEIRIDPRRLLARLEALAQIGEIADGGVSRVALSDADREGRDQLVVWMRDAGLEVRIDRIGNIFGLRPGKEDLPSLMSGSHLDTVTEAGRYDGSYGVLAALEVAETLNDHRIETRHPLAVVSFTNEEGVRYTPDMLGSLVYAGGLPLEEALQIRGFDGSTLGEELRRIGYAGAVPCGEIAPAAYVELHIEQGPVLEQQGLTIGAVENLMGICWQEITVRGQANHAGT
ncbi:MAG: hydantoinase/carbamoylase family amidase, partial [Calditrichaeota bacterium]|nr:hydantoinase/carbamoylase family amidase [Calditrichota bacterium]